MAQGRHTLMDPPIEDLLDKVDPSSPWSRWVGPRPPGELLLQQSGRGPGQGCPAQVASVSGKPVSIAFEEIAAGKATYTRADPEEEAALVAAIADAAEAGLLAEGERRVQK